MTKESTLTSEYTDIYEICHDGWSDYLKNAEVDLAYYHGAQFTQEELERADDQGRTLHTIDKTARQVNLLHGYEIRNRHILKIGPVGMPQQQEDEACRQHTAMTMALMAQNRGYSVMSNSFKFGTLIEGSNLFEFWRDRERRLRFNRLGWNQFLLNPSLTKTDLSDCDDILTGRWISKDKVKMLVPTADLKGITPLRQGVRWRYLGNPELGNRADNRMHEEWWKRRTKFIPTVISRVSGQELPFKEFADKFYNGDTRYANAQIQEMQLPGVGRALTKYRKPVDEVTLTVLVDGEPVWEGPNPLGMRDYNHVWFHGDWCPEQPRDELKLRSFVRRIREPQRAYNRRINQIYDIIESQIQAGRIARSKYLLNPEASYKSGQGVVFQANKDFPDEMPLRELIDQFTGADVPQSLFAALEATDKADMDAGGLNQEIFGSDDKDISGFVQSLRTGQALTGQAGMFQGFRDSKSEVGRKNVRLVQLNYSRQKVAEILNEMPTQGFYKEDLAKFDCTPVEGLLTDTQQQLFYQELKMLRQNDPTFQQLIPASLLIKYFPGQTRSELVQAIQQAEQQQKQQAAQQQQDQQRINNLIESQTAASVARAQEDLNDIPAQRAKMGLDRVKTMAEIQKLGAAPFTDLRKQQVAMEKIRSDERTKQQQGKAKP